MSVFTWIFGIVWENISNTLNMASAHVLSLIADIWKLLLLCIIHFEYKRTSQQDWNELEITKEG